MDSCIPISEIVGRVATDRMSNDAEIVRKTMLLMQHSTVGGSEISETFNTMTCMSPTAGHAVF